MSSKGIAINSWVLWVTAALLPVIIGCAGSQPRDKNSSSSNQGYTTTIPSQNFRPSLDRIQRSVKKIIITGIYYTYQFEDIYLTEDDLKDVDLMKASTRRIVHDESSVGTAISISDNNRSVLLLTSGHVVTMPDTIVSYYREDDIPRSTYVKGITVLSQQNNLIFDDNGLAHFEVINTNPNADLALIQVSKNSEQPIDAPVLGLPKGDPRQLEWGTFLYVIGYPKGRPMITRAIVSDPNYDRRGGFLADAIFNRGFSGGLIIAARNHTSSFEWVGVANSTSASEEQFLVPNPIRSHRYQRFDAYTDTAFIETRSRIDYGITEPTSISRVTLFLLESAPLLEQHGFTIRALLR